MTTSEFDALLTKLINAGYDCGEWDGDPNETREEQNPYDELLKKLSAAKQAVLAAVAEMMKEREQ